MTTKQTISTVKPSKGTRARRRSLRQDTRGISTVEYVIILVLVAVAGFGVFRTFGTNVKNAANKGATTIRGLSTSGTAAP